MNPALLFELLNSLVSTLLQWLASNWVFSMSCSMVTIICLVINAIENPTGAANEFLITIMSSVLILFPSTPEEWKLNSLLTAFDQNFPMIGGGVLAEIFQGVAGMAAIYFVVKMWKLIPFV